MRKPKPRKPISEATRSRILEAAWDLITDDGRADVGLAEIAARAGVSRQTVFYAFGNRAGVLTAMVRHRDSLSDHVDRIRAALLTEQPTLETLTEAVGVWIEYLPLIYPAGILLDAASLTDEDAAEAWNDRMIDALLRGLVGLAGRLHGTGALLGDPQRLAEEIWAQVHPTMWRRLVVERDWSPGEFRASRLAIVRSLVADSAGRTGGSERA